MANPFDQFDAPEANPFDQFDAPKPKAPVSGGLVAAAKQAIGGTIKGAGQAAADFLPGVDQDNALKRYGQGVVDANPTAVSSLADLKDKPLTGIAEATGNAGGSMGAMLGARALGMGITAASPLAGPAAPLIAGLGQAVSWAGPAAAAALPSFGGIREKQIQDDPTRQDSVGSKLLAAAGAGTVGLIESKLGPNKWAEMALSKQGRDALAEKFVANSLAGSIAKGAAKGAAIEGAEELAQNPIEQLASYQNPLTAENLKDTAFSGVMGALGGGVLGGASGAAFRGNPEKPGQNPDVTPTQHPAPTFDPAIQQQMLADQEQEALGINPADGPLSAVASTALHTGAAKTSAQIAIEQERQRMAEAMAQQDASESEIADATGAYDQAESQRQIRLAEEARRVEQEAKDKADFDTQWKQAQTRDDIRNVADQVLAEGAYEADQRKAAQFERMAQEPSLPFERIAPEDYDTLNPIKLGEGQLVDPVRPALPAPDSSRKALPNSQGGAPAIGFTPQKPEPMRATADGQVGTPQQFDDLARTKATRKDQMRRAEDRVREMVQAGARMRGRDLVAPSGAVVMPNLTLLQAAKARQFTREAPNAQQDQSQPAPAQAVQAAPQGPKQQSAVDQPAQQEAQNVRTLRPATEGDYPQGSVDARSVGNNSLDRGGVDAGDQGSRNPAEPDSGVPDTRNPRAVRKLVPRRGATLNDSRLSTHAEDIKAMSGDAGWQEIGGRMVRSPEGTVSRTKWLPRSEWFVAGMQSDPKALAEAIDRSARGLPIYAKDRRTISGMMDWLDAQKSGASLNEDSSAYDIEATGYNDMSEAEQDAFDVGEDLFDASPAPIDGFLRSIGFTEDEIRAETQASRSESEDRRTPAREPREGAQGAGNDGKKEAGAILKSYSEQDLAARDEAQRLKAEENARKDKAADDKARADSERDSFTLTGSDRSADTAAAQGQGDIFDQPAKNAQPTQINGQQETRNNLIARLDAAEDFSEEQSNLIDKLYEVTLSEVSAMHWRGDMPIFETGRNTFMTISPSTQQPGKTQVTLYSNRGISGDTQYDSVEAAVRGERLFGNRILSPADAEDRFAESLNAEAEYQANVSRQRMAPDRPAQNQNPIKNESRANADAGAGTADLIGARDIEIPANAMRLLSDAEERDIVTVKSVGQSFENRLGIFNGGLHVPSEADIASQMKALSAARMGAEVEARAIGKYEAATARLIDQAIQHSAVGRTLSNVGTRKAAQAPAGAVTAGVQYRKTGIEFSNSAAAKLKEARDSAAFLEALRRRDSSRSSKGSVKSVADRLGLASPFAVQDPVPDSPAVGNAPSPLEALFSGLDSSSVRKANKAKKAAKAHPLADKIQNVQDNFLDILQELEDSGKVKINC